MRSIRKMAISKVRKHCDMVCGIAVLLLLLTGCAEQTTPNTEDVADGGMSVVKNPTVTIQTDKGDIVFELYMDKAPLTSKNFKTLADKGFYNGLKFHRVIRGFMIQGGDPQGDGTGGPGYEIEDEFGPGLKFNTDGIVAMANAGPDTGGSQFFITEGQTPWLDGKHAIFGKIIKGMDVVRNTQQGAVMKKVTVA